MAHSSSKTSKPRRSVRFARRSDVFLVPALNDMSDEEIEASWTTDFDSKESQKEIIKTVKAMRRNSAKDDQELCTRGLEHMQSAAHLEQARINKDCVFSAVLDEQERQWSLGINDENEIAKISSHHSRWASDSAINKAASDAAFVDLMSITEPTLEQSDGAPLIPKVLENALQLSRAKEVDESRDLRRRSDPGVRRLPFPRMIECAVVNAGVFNRKTRSVSEKIILGSNTERTSISP